MFAMTEWGGNRHGLGRKNDLRIAKAKAVCAECPVFDACDAWYTKHPDPWMITAGQTPEERRLKVRPRGQPIPHGTPHGARLHRQTGEPMCILCRLAAAADHRERRARKKGAAA
jgi:hypothetical protein